MEETDAHLWAPQPTEYENTPGTPRVTDQQNKTADTTATTAPANATTTGHTTPTKAGKPVNLKHLARDVVVLTTNGLYPLEDILAVYGFTIDEYHSEIYRLPVYQTEYQHWEKRVQADDKALMREQARLVAEANISTINERLKDPKSKTSDVINGLRLLMEIGDMMPKKDDRMSGITVMIDFGQSMNQQIAQGHGLVIEHEPRRAVSQPNQTAQPHNQTTQAAQPTQPTQPTQPIQPYPHGHTTSQSEHDNG